MTAAKLNSIYTDKITNGTKFVALFSDGSGASIYYTDKAGKLFNANCEEYASTPNDYLDDAGYSEWIELPADFKLLGERE